MSKVPGRTATFDQIALAVRDIDRAEELLGSLVNHTEFTRDSVVAAGGVADNSGVVANRATLSFNYDLIPGHELELLRYEEGPSWHDPINDLDPRPFMSHLGIHVNDINACLAWAEARELEVIQHVRTTNHTNEAIKDSRRYEYVIVDTRDVLGCDLKFIKRYYLSDDDPDRDRPRAA